MINSEYLKNLNSFQKEAVLHTSGPLLIVAGAGSGKTQQSIDRTPRPTRERARSNEKRKSCAGDGTGDDVTKAEAKGARHDAFAIKVFCGARLVARRSHGVVAALPPGLKRHRRTRR